MSDQPSTAVAVRDAAAPAPLPPMDDREMARLWRTAKALAESRLFKDALQAGQAFAKILAGRDLGLTPFEAMGSLHVIEGKIEAGADLHATRVRSREGYDFRVAWLKRDGEQVVAVWADEEELADMRPIVGCAIEFTVGGERRGVSRWTVEDSVTAGLLKDRSNHQKFPRSMYFARAMTNGVAWYVPEVMGGMRVYGAGEIEHGTDDDAAGVGSGEAPGVELPTEVEAVIARALDLGHVGLSNRETVELTLAGQPPERIAEWVRGATMQLNRMAKANGEPITTEPETATPADEGETVDAEPVEEGIDQWADRVAAEHGGEPDTEEGRAAMSERVQALFRAADQAFSDGDEEKANDLRDEAFQLEAELRAEQDPEQGSLGV